MSDAHDGPGTLTDDEIETQRFESPVAATDDTTDTGDDAGDTTDTGDDAPDTGDDSGDAADTSDTGDDS